MVIGFSSTMADTTFAKPQIIPYGEESTDSVTLFDCKWIPSSPRFVALGSHIKGHGLIRTYSLASSSGSGDNKILHQKSNN